MAKNTGVFFVFCELIFYHRIKNTPVLFNSYKRLAENVLALDTFYKNVYIHSFCKDVYLLHNLSFYCVMPAF